MTSDISLRTIPSMREFANETLVDVLLFMVHGTIHWACFRVSLTFSDLLLPQSPEHHDIIIDIVTREMNTGTSMFYSSQSL